MNRIASDHRAGGPPAIVLVHGNSSSRALWRPLMDRLSDCELLAIDLRGHGDSEWISPPNYSTAGYAYDVAHAVREITSPEFILVGHSNGALASARFASRLEPSQTRSSISISHPVFRSIRSRISGIGQVA